MPSIPGEMTIPKIDRLVGRFALNAEAVHGGLRESGSGLVTGVCVHQSSGDALTDEKPRLAKSIRSGYGWIEVSSGPHAFTHAPRRIEQPRYGQARRVVG